MEFTPIAHALTDFQRGRFLIVVDDEHRENEGDLVIAAERITPSKVNFMIRKGGGLICMPLPGKRLDELRLPLMVPDEQNTEATRCRFTISVDAKGHGTGISASDRCETIKALLNPATTPEHLAKPGHIFPLRAAENGLKEREGHTEAALALCALAGMQPGAVICEILDEDGNTAQMEQLEAFAEKHGLSIISIEELIAFKEQNI